MATNKNMANIIDEISLLEQKISSGDASIDEVLSFQNKTQCLYEKATWLKFEAMKELGTNNETKTITPKEPTQEPLIKSTPAQNDEESEKERPAFNFSSAFSKPEKETIETKENIFSEKKEEPKKESVKEKPQDIDSQTSLLDAIGTDDQSINDALMEDEDNSLASKMQKSPISDLSTAIGMNDRFSYISDLFNDDSEKYNRAIEQLNALENKLEAKEKLSDLAVEYSWDLESKIVQMFVELVERRYT